MGQYLGRLSVFLGLLLLRRLFMVEVAPKTAHVIELLTHFHRLVQCSIQDIEIPNNTIQRSGDLLYKLISLLFEAGHVVVMVRDQANRIMFRNQ